MKTIPLLIVLSAIASASLAATLIVPDQYSTIQGAILAASAGDSVLVRPGTYTENINYRFKRIAVVSEAGPAATIIDGSQPSDPDSGTVAIVNGDGALLEGFTVRGGTGMRPLAPFGTSTSAGGVAILANATVRGNWITENHVLGETVFGGAVVAASSSGFLIAGNRIYSNISEWTGSTSGRGGGITIGAGNGIIEWNEVFDNEANWVGGIYEFGVTFTTIRDNLIVCNRNGGVEAYSVVGNTIVANTFFGVRAVYSVHQRNTITDNLGYGAINCVPGGSCNNFFGNEIENPDCLGPGNISVDPLYGETGCPASYCLQPDSPLLPEHSPPGCDLIGARGVCDPLAVDVLTSSEYASGPLVARPNPFNPATTLAFVLPERREVTLAIYDATGRLVAVLFNGVLPAGEHEAIWDGRDTSGSTVASGAYVVVLQSPKTRLSQKLLLLK